MISSIALVLLAAGSSVRFKHGCNAPAKQWMRTGNQALWQFVLRQFTQHFDFAEVKLLASFDDANYMQQFTEYDVVIGGNSRQESLANALATVQAEWVLVHDAARLNISAALIKNLINQAKDFDAVIPFLPLNDTSMLASDYVNRQDIRRIITPQLSQKVALKQALKQAKQLYTDESSCLAAAGYKLHYVSCAAYEQDAEFNKLTHSQDLKKFNLAAPNSDCFSGFGIDTHCFVKDQTMKLGGISIESDYGFLAHSDGDIVLHALIDAIFGACGLEDIGSYFPNDDTRYKGMDSQKLFTKCLEKITHLGFCLVNIDLSIMMEAPKLKDYKLAIKKNIAQLASLPLHKVAVKATTAEKNGLCRSQRGCYCLC